MTVTLSVTPIVMGIFTLLARLRTPILPPSTSVIKPRNSLHDTTYPLSVIAKSGHSTVPVPAIAMSTTSKKNSSFDFKVSEEEIDMAKLVPKLKGVSNWREWGVQMFMVFGFNNRVYVQLIRDQIKTPPSPVYEDPSYSSVSALFFKQSKGNKDKEIRITEAAIEARSIQIVASNNLELQKRHADGEEK